LLVLLPALAVLQYRWVGQVSTAERERMQRNLRVAAFQFREGFDGEVGRAFASLQVGPNTAREGASDRYSDRYDTWLNTSAHPQIVNNIFLVDGDHGALRLRRWIPDSHTFDSAPWPPVLQSLKPQFERELAEFNSGRPPDRRLRFRDEDPLLVAPIRNVIVNPPAGSRPQAVEPVFGFTVLELDLRYIRGEFLPALAERHFVHPGGDVYRVAVTETDQPTNVIYRSDPSAPVDVARADAVESLFSRSGQALFRPGDGPPPFRPGDRPRRNESPGGAEARAIASGASTDREATRPRREELGRWRLVVQHQSGSLEAAVAGVRRRNLAISFGVLLMLSLSVGILAVTSRRAHRLAQQQMEFVAGISHELRTPVAVIRSAAENLSHGVVGSGERVKRYGQVIESEARRLGEMVERVLQYAGIESGLGLGSRMPLAPSDIIESAIDSAMPLAGTDTIDLHREIPSDLPPVVGDAAALRSAVQNLIANAAKYGGAERWVGVRAEVVVDRRKPAVKISVTDHGPGIPISELAHIFEPFYRGADALTRQIHGNGLGLSLVKRIVAAHGGSVTVTSRVGVGSVFAITLPSAEPDARSNTVSSEMRAAAQS
jgi:signal transduction histidine kinase